ncbi:hypothetical protein D3C71_2179080 [compost metagenome]
MRLALRCRVTLAVLTNPMRETRFVVSGGILENRLFVRRCLDAHAAEIAIGVPGLDAQAALIN